MISAMHDSPLGAAPAVVARLKERGRWLLTAESCTAGRLAAAITAVPGSSGVYLGGVVSYSPALKQQLLGVPATTLRRAGAVSAETARAMASGALTILGKEVMLPRLSLATTGVAGPDALEGDGEGQPPKPAGLVYIALGTPKEVQVQELRLSGSREEVLAQAVDAALKLLLAELG